MLEMNLHYSIQNCPGGLLNEYCHRLSSMPELADMCVMSASKQSIALVISIAALTRTKAN